MNKREKTIVTLSVTFGVVSLFLAFVGFCVSASVIGLLRICEQQKSDYEVQFLPKRYVFEDDETEGK